MTDIKTKEARSKNMAAIKGKNTKPELFLRKELFSQGYRYRINSSSVPGHPDIWLRKYNTAIFVHGCFWHRHKECKFSYMPKSRVEFWTKKFNDNVERDLRIQNELQDRHIRYIIVWECTIKKMMRSLEYKNIILNNINLFLASDKQHVEL